MPRVNFCSLVLAAALAVPFAAPASADPTVGLGVSFSFGGGNVETGVGLRVFSDNERDSFAGSVGVDYLFKAQRIRPTIGVAYLGNRNYFGLDLGFDIGARGLDYGVTAGWLNTEDEPGAPVAPPPPPPPTGTQTVQQF